MVGADEHGELLARGAQPLADRFDDAVDLLDGIDFLFSVAVVSALVGRFHMHIHKVQSFQQRVDAGICLALKVGVPVARCARDVNDLKSR